MAKKKTATDDAAVKDDNYEAQMSPTGEAAVVVQPTRELRAGTIVYLPGDTTPLTLAANALVWGRRIDRDAHFVGMLAGHQGNWDLNIDQVEGTWSPVTGQRQPDETENGNL